MREVSVLDLENVVGKRIREKVNNGNGAGLRKEVERRMRGN